MNDTSQPSIAKLVFKDFSVHKVLYERKTNHRQFQMEIRIAHVLKDNPEEEFKDNFQCIFNIELVSKEPQKENDTDSLEHVGPEGALVIQIEARGIFSIQGEVPKEVKDNYYDISSPSIIFPYVRSFLANFSAMTGINAITLPLVAFKAAPKEDNTEKEDNSENN